MVTLLMCMMPLTFLYRDSSIAPLLDMRRRFKAVMNVLDSMISHGVTLSRSVELYCPTGKILSIGPLYPVVLFDLHAVEGFGFGYFRRVVGDVHRRLSDFIHGVVVHRRDEAIRWWRYWLREDPLVHPYRWLRPDLVPPAPFLQCQPHLTPGGSGVLADPAKIDEEFRKDWLPYFCCSGQRDTSLEEFNREVEGWLLLLPEFDLPRLTVRCLLMLFLERVLLPVALMVGGGGSSRSWMVPGMMGWLVFLPRLRRMVSGRRVCWMLTLS